MKTLSKNFFVLLLMLVCFSSYKKLKITKDLDKYTGIEATRTKDLDKYTGIEATKIKENWVRDREEGKYIAFNFTIAKSSSGDIDHYLVLIVDNNERTMAKYFSVGKHLILTLNRSEKLNLNISGYYATGKNTSLSSGSDEQSTYLTEEIFNKIIEANSIYFELQGNRFSNLPEVTGTFSEKNLEKYKKFKCYVSIKTPRKFPSCLSTVDVKGVKVVVAHPTEPSPVSTAPYGAAIGEKYSKLGGANSPLGPVTAPEADAVGGGRAQTFRGAPSARILK